MNMPSHAKGQARSVLAPVQALTTLDRAWADFLCQQIPATCETQIWLAALTSHQWGRGHACLDVTALQTDAAALLGWTQADAQALPSNWAQALASLPWCEGDTAPLVASANRLYLRRAWRAETRIRQHLQARQDGAPVQVDPSTNGLDALFGPVDPQAPQHSQRLACAMALRQRTCIITGGPGTGKTTTVMRLLALLQAAHGPAPLRVLLAAPTGKAAARLNASMAQAHAALPADWQTALPAEAQTLHKMLGWHGLATPLTGQRQRHTVSHGRGRATLHLQHPSVTHRASVVRDIRYRRHPAAVGVRFASLRYTGPRRAPETRAGRPVRRRSPDESRSCSVALYSILGRTANN